MDLIYYYLPALETIRDFLEMGGDVLYIIAALLMFMWAMIIERLVYLRLGHKRLASMEWRLHDGLCVGIALSLICCCTLRVSLCLSSFCVFLCLSVSVSVSVSASVSLRVSR